MCAQSKLISNHIIYAYYICIIYIYVKLTPEFSKVGSNCLIVIVCCEFFTYIRSNHYL